MAYLVSRVLKFWNQNGPLVNAVGIAEIEHGRAAQCVYDIYLTGLRGSTLNTLVIPPYKRSKVLTM
jgi:hypothetical protein